MDIVDFTGGYSGVLGDIGQPGPIEGPGMMGNPTRQLPGKVHGPNTSPPLQPHNPLEFGFKSDDAVENLPKDNVERDILAACGTLARTLIAKRRDYGPGNIGKHGEFGILVRLDDKLTRIDNLRKNGATPANESVGDSWLDAAGYSIIGYLFTQGKW